MRFSRYIGIDYSGAATPVARLPGLQVYLAEADRAPARVDPPAPGARNWSRLEVAQYCTQALQHPDPVVIGIDHGFSFPDAYLHRYGLSDWDAFLHDFVRHWPTAEPHTRVDALRERNPRTGHRDELRLCEQWTATAKSVFLFDVQGSVAKSTHAGLPWLSRLREMPPPPVPVHFWPFDGFDVPAGRSVIAEAYPALYKRRFGQAGRKPDAHDAWSIAAWLQTCDRRGRLTDYFNPPLTSAERMQAAREGWILGVW